MVFYNEKIIIAEEINKVLNVFRKIENEIIMYYILVNGKELEEKVIAKDSIEDFDAEFYLNNLYMVYKNDKKELKLISVKDNKEELIYKELDNTIYELNLTIKDGEKNIFFIGSSKEDKNIYNINQFIYNEGNVESYIVDKIVTHNFISPLKVILEDNSIYIAYYFKNQICLKEYNFEYRIWSPSYTLTDNRNKLYLDMILIGNNLHLVYSEYKDDNFCIKYEKFYIKRDNIMKEKEENLSDFGNNTDPILIYHLNKLWVVWKGTNQFMSKVSEDNGESFSELYTWKEPHTVDLVKYKYITNTVEKGIKIDYSYGSYYPEIKFIGFGKSD